MQPAAVEPPATELARAKSLQQRGELARAEAAYRRLLEAAPDHAEILNNLGNVLRGLKRSQEALECLEQADRSRPDHPIILTNLGLALADLGLFEDAAARHRRALEIDATFAPAHNNLGLALKELGRLAEAEANYRRALELNPRFSEALNNLGNLLRSQEKLQEAISCLRRALEIRPAFSDARLNLANALHQHDNLIAAEAEYRAAVALAPDNTDALIGLGDLLVEVERPEEAVAFLSRVVALRPNSPEAHASLGMALLICGRAEEAAARHKVAMSLEPAGAKSWAKLAAFNMVLGSLEEARRCVEKAIEIDPGLALAHVTRLALGDDSLSSDYLRQVEALAQGPRTLPLRQLYSLRFALGKGYEKMGRYDEAFLNIAEGARLRRSTIEYDEPSRLGWFQRIVQSFSPALIRSKSNVGLDSDIPIFIVGFLRSGTTLTEQILASHPDVHGAGELSFVGELLPNLGIQTPLHCEFPESISLLPDAQLLHAGEAYVARIKALAPRARRITDKMPQNYALLGLIHLILPRAKIVHVRRNPVDCCLSCYATNFTRGQYFTYDLRELGHYYLAYLELMEHWRQILPADSMFEVYYENLVDSPESQVRKLLEYCNLPWDERCLAFHETKRAVRTASMTQVRQPMYRSSVERWRRYEKYLGPLLEALGPAVGEYRVPSDGGKSKSAANPGSRN
jgi:tetratricopeptide (TPR) repeat protein